MAKKESTTSGQVAPTAPSLPPFPAFSQTPLGQRMAMMSQGVDGSLPVWANGGNLTNFDPGAAPLSTTPATSAAPSPYGSALPPVTSAPREQAAPALSTEQSPWAAANPLARPGEPPRLGDDIRSDIFRQIYRTGKRSDTPAGPMLMNIGKPSVPQADPLAALNPIAEPESPPRYLDASGNTAPPAGNIVPNTGYGVGPQSAQGTGRAFGPAGRLAARMKTGGGQGQMAPPGVAGTTPRGPQFSQLPAPRGPNRTGQRRSTTTPRRSLLRRP
jgi:hypothetical protein